MTGGRIKCQLPKAVDTLYVPLSTLSSATPSTTVTITSTKDSVAHDWSVLSSPEWLTATATNNTILTLSIEGQPPATDQTGTVTIKQNDSGEEVTMSISYTAPVQISYTISYSANGGTGTVGSQDVTQGASFTTRANAFTRAGYTFSGWNTAADGGGSAYAANTSIVNSFSANTTLYAQWTASTNTAYKVEHYKVSSTGKVTLAATQNLKGTTAAKVTAQARSFTGFTQGTKHRLRVATGTISANGTLTLKLYYKVNSYTITYAPNGATGTSVKQTVYYGESFKVRAASTFKRPGYTFSSWNTQAKGGGTTF